MININKLSYSFSKKDLYKEISFNLEEGQHCAFIGISGSGKSSLVDLIMDPEKYMFDGEIEIDPESKIGYVSQFYRLDRSKDITVFEYIGGESIKLEKKLASLALQMETSSDIDSLLEEYQETSDAFDSLGGLDFESQINKKLNLANLKHLKDLTMSELSGGEFKLIQVIKEMLNLADLMIMDEPDVFLDFENLNSLKNLINSYRGTLLVITHNRYLLNYCFNKIIHLENMELEEFDGKYIDYRFSLLERKIELQELAHADTEEIKRNQALILKFRKAAEENASAAIGQHVNSRVKIQERLERRRIEEPFVAIKEPEIILNTDINIEETVALKVSDYSLAFDELLLENVDFEIGSKDKVVLIGPNGTGKTTLLREIFENKNNSIEINGEMEVAYLSQLQSEMLDDSKTIMEDFLDSGFKTIGQVLACISNYGFDEDFANQSIGSLSGGEKNMLQLAKLSISKANMLLLDEPTSHLDTYSQIALEKAIENYTGAILMVSHDFYSIVNCMDYVLIIEDKTIRRMNMKKFRRMIYKSHFDRDYLELESNKKSLETKIDLALKDKDFTLAKTLSQELKKLIESF